MNIGSRILIFGWNTIFGKAENIGCDGNALHVKIANDAASDAFSRLRIPQPFTLFDSKQLYDNAPSFWDDSEESGASTTSTHSINAAATTIGVALNTAGKRTRQTFMRFNYQPGKSQLILLTGGLDASGGGTGITRSIGINDDNNGLFFEDNAGTINIVRRSKASGSVVDTKVVQASWNIDTMDGSGDSKITVDFTKTQIFIIDFQWLAVGRVRFGFDINGKIVYCHEVNNANNLAEVYMSTPNLPIRYQIENDGTGAASTLLHICASIISEGGIEENGILRYASTDGTNIDANTADTLYAVMGLRLKSTALSCSVSTIATSMISETNDDFEWVILFNPTVAGTFTYANETDSCVQTAKGATANTVTGGTKVSGGFSKQDSIAATEAIFSARRLGASIGNTPDEIVLCVRPLSANADIQGSITWRELS